MMAIGFLFIDEDGYLKYEYSDFFFIENKVIMYIE